MRTRCDAPQAHRPSGRVYPAVPAFYLSAMGGHILEQLACDYHLSDFLSFRRRSPNSLIDIENSRLISDSPDVAAAAMDSALPCRGLRGRPLQRTSRRAAAAWWISAASATATSSGAASANVPIGEGPHGFDLNVHLCQH